MLTVFSLVCLVASVEPLSAARDGSLVEQLDAVAGKPLIVTGIATNFDCKLGAFVIHGKGGDAVWFPFISWSDEIRTSGSAANTAEMDLWLTIRTTVRVNPLWRADGKYPPEPSEFRTALSGKTPERYYFSDFQIVRMETKARQADGAPAVLSRSPIVLDPKP